MSASGWAKREVEIAIKKKTDDPYDKFCYESALEAFELLCRQGHTGYSMTVTKYILDRLIDGRPLTPIEESDDIWLPAYSKPGEETYQCTRMPSLFKKVHANGTVTYSDVDRYVGYDVGDPGLACTNAFMAWYVDRLYPIKLPYMPTLRKFELLIEYSYIPDHIRVVEYTTPGGKKVEDGQWYRETEDGYEEVDE